MYSFAGVPQTIGTWSDTEFIGTVVNRVLSSLHGESLEITLTALISNKKAEVIKFAILNCVKQNWNKLVQRESKQNEKCTPSFCIFSLCKFFAKM